MTSNNSPHEDHIGGGDGKPALSLLLSLLVMYPLTMALIVRWSDLYLILSNVCVVLMMVARWG